jgi:hypothetical protein
MGTITELRMCERTPTIAPTAQAKPLGHITPVVCDSPRRIELGKSIRGPAYCRVAFGVSVRRTWYAPR